MLFRRWYSQLFDLVFSACEHGGGRPKQTRFLTTVPTLMQLQKQCSGNHKHLPYNISWDNNKWNFDTSKEAEYPHLLCQRYVSFVCQHLKLPTPPAVSKRHSTCLATAQQPRIAQLIPEFVHINTVAKSKLPADTSTFKILESLNTTGDHKREGESMVRVGKYHTMKQFFDKAKSLPHPFSTHNAVSDEVKSVIFDIFSEGITATASWRIKQIDRISKMKHEMRFEEARFKAGLPAHVQEVLGGKPILLWKKLLQETNFPDLGVVDFMHGVPLTGRHSKSPLFGEKVVLAKTTTELLVASSKWRNKALLARVAHSDDPKLQQVLWEETMKECSKGFINGLFQTLDEVRKNLGVEDICLTRRFVILQGSGDEVKPRVIDDAKESAVNSAYTALERLELHDFDHMVSIASLISSIYGGDGMVRISELDGQVVQKPIHKELLGNCRWQGRCLDLSKAYKQVPIDRTSRGLMVLLVPEPGSQQPKFFTTSSMPFGCASSVFAFNRITRSLLHLFHKLLKMPSGVFYDDFALLEPSGGATLASMAAENLLELLGWKYAKEGSKASKFEPCFNLLGAQLNLASLHEGFVKVSNKPSRLVKLKELLAAMKQNRHISKSEAQSMHGLLNYASGFFLGQSLKTASRAFANLVARPHGADGDEVAKLCDFTHAMLEISKPRSWNCWSDDWPIIVFTDGAYEDPKGTWGAVVFEPGDGKTSTYAGDVPSRLMEGWKKLAGEQIICQIEAFAVLLIRQRFSEAWKEKRAIFFVDNEAARFSLIKGSSPSPSMQLIAHLFHQLDASSPLMVWIERVPSASNIADLPSRGKWEETLKIVGGTFEGDIKLPDHMVEELVTSKILPVELLRKSND